MGQKERVSNGRRDPVHVDMIHFGAQKSVAWSHSLVLEFFFLFET